MNSFLRRYIGDRFFYRRLFAVMLPILLQNVITNFVSLLDNIMVGQVGTEPMSGVAIVNQLFFVFNLSVFGAYAGAGILTAQFYGRGDMEGVRRTMRLKLWTGAAALGLFMGLFCLRGEALIRLFLHKGGETLDLEATLRYGRDYLNLMLLQMLPFALGQVYSSTLRETGETVLPMRAGLAAVFVNLIFNYILIFGKLGAPALGVVGAAWATVLSRFVECGIVMIGGHRRCDRHPWLRGLCRTAAVPRPLVKKVLRMGLPLLLNEFLWSGGMAAANLCFSQRGLEVVTAINITETVTNLFFCSFFAVGSAIAIMVGQLLGAGRLAEAVEEDRRLIAFAVAMCAALGLLMVPLAPLLPRLYNTTPAIKDLARRMLLVCAAMLPVNAFSAACYFTLRSGGRTWITFAFDSFFVWTVTIPAAYLLVRFTALPVLPLYLAVYLLDTIKCAVGFVLVRRQSWVKNLVNNE